MLGRWREIPLVWKILCIVLALLLSLTAAFLAWALTPAGPMDEALAALGSDDEVELRSGKWLEFHPVRENATVGFIFYPGGRVDHRSYAPAARDLAALGFLVVIVPMTLNLAFFSHGRAADVIAAHPDIDGWAVGGHSLGGAMAARFAYRNPGSVDGLVLWAAYPASSDDLSDLDLAAVSIYGTRDGLTTGEKIDDSRPLMPANTTWVAIEGGNHAQFGWYGSQSRDLEPMIGRREQQAAIVEATATFLKGLQTGQQQQ